MATQAATQAAGSLRATAADDSPSVSKQDQHPQSPATPASGVSALFARLRSRIHGKGSGTSKTHPEDPLGTRSPAASSTYSSIGLDDDDDGRGQSSAIGSGGVSGYESDDDTDYNSPTPATATATATASVSNIASKTGDSAATAVPQVRSIAIKGVAKAAAASALSIGRHSSTSVPVDLSHATTALRVTTDATAGTLDVCGCDVASVCGASRSRTRSFGNRLCEELARDRELMVQDVHIPAAMLLPSPLNAALGTTPSSMVGGRSPPMSAMSGGIGGGASSLGSIRSIGSTHEYVECTLQPMDSVVLTPSDAATKHSHAHSHSHSHQRHRSVSQSLSPLYEAPLQSSGDMELTPSPDPMAQAGNDSVTADDADADAALVANLTTTICMYHRASLSRAIYVSLLDRHDEMRELYSRHADFFRNIHSSLQSLCVDGNKAACVAASADLERLLFISRDEMPDLEWLSRLKALVGIVPSLWSHFKDIVGYDHAADEEMERLEHGEGASETPAVHSDAEHHPMAAGGAKNAAANASTDEADDADVEDADDPSSS